LRTPGTAQPIQMESNFRKGQLLPLLVAAITLAFLGNCGRLYASVGRQGAADIVAFFELAALASADVPFVAFVRLDQFAWHHTLLWKNSGYKAGVVGSFGGHRRWSEAPCFD
jgi:hypothetical protein